MRSFQFGALLFVLAAACASPSQLVPPDFAMDTAGGPPSTADAPDLSTTPADLAQPTPPHPRLYVDDTGLAAIRAALAQDPLPAAFAQLEADVAAALSREPSAPAVFDVPGYYLDKDAHRAAKQVLINDGGGAFALALHARLLPPGDPRIVEERSHARAILDDWAGTTKQVTNVDGPLVMAYKGVFLLYAADLLLDDPAWPAAQRQAFLDWSATVFRPAMNVIATQPDNEGCWGRLGLVAVAALRDEDALALSLLDEVRAYLGTAIAENGELPEENKRHVKGMKYTFFALSPLTLIAQIARLSRYPDLYDYTTPNGRSLRLALDRLFAYALDPSTWPYTTPTDPLQILLALASPSALEREDPNPLDLPGNLYEAMARVYDVPAWAAWTAPGVPIHGSELWVYPTLLRPALTP